MIRLATAALVVLLGIIPNTAVASSYDGEIALASCNKANGYGGGVELFNGENQTGGSRVMCAPIHIGVYADNHFGGIGGVFTDIGAFNDKADSARLRVNPGCNISFYWYTNANEDGTEDSVHKYNGDSTVVNVDINMVNNVASSGNLTQRASSCDD